jgi:hypothetical protein
MAWKRWLFPLSLSVHCQFQVQGLWKSNQWNWSDAVALEKTDLSNVFAKFKNIDFLESMRRKINTDWAVCVTPVLSENGELLDPVFG